MIDELQTRVFVQIEEWTPDGFKVVFASTELRPNFRDCRSAVECNLDQYGRYLEEVLQDEST